MILRIFSLRLLSLQSIDKTGGASALYLASKNGIDKAASPLIALAHRHSTADGPEFWGMIMMIVES